MTLGSWLLVTYMVICAGIITMCIRSIRRTRAVTAYLRGVLTKVGEGCTADIYRGRDYHWRWKMFESVDYEDFLKYPWKPLDTYYPDQTFLDPEASDPALLKPTPFPRQVRERLFSDN